MVENTVEDETEIKASIVQVNLLRFLGWGNNPHLETLKSEIESDSKGHITVSSIERLSYLAGEHLSSSKSIIHKNQLRRFLEFIDSIYDTDDDFI